MQLCILCVTNIITLCYSNYVHCASILHSTNWIILNKNKYSLKHPVLTRKSVASDGIWTHASHILGKCPNHYTTNTIFLVPSSKGYARLETKSLTLTEWSLLQSFYILHFCASVHLCMCTSVICTSVQWRYLPPVSYFSDIYIDLNKNNNSLKHPVLPRKSVASGVIWTHVSCILGKNPNN